MTRVYFRRQHCPSLSKERPTQPVSMRSLYEVDDTSLNAKQRFRQKVFSIALMSCISAAKVGVWPTSWKVGGDLRASSCSTDKTRDSNKRCLSSSMRRILSRPFWSRDTIGLKGAVFGSFRFGWLINYFGVGCIIQTNQRTIVKIDIPQLIIITLGFTWHRLSFRIEKLALFDLQSPPRSITENVSNMWWLNIHVTINPDIALSSSWSWLEIVWSHVNSINNKLCLDCIMRNHTSFCWAE